MYKWSKNNGKPRIWIHFSDTRHELIGDTLNLEEVLICVGGDDKFNAYIRTLPSCLSGTFSEYVHGDGRCVAAHVSRSATRGIAYKAPYHTVPLTQAEHLNQHQHGYEFYKPWDWWLDRLRYYREKWAANVLTDKLSLNGNLKHDLDALSAWFDKNCMVELLEDRLQDKRGSLSYPLHQTE
jgi:hypothetical protein